MTTRDKVMGAAICGLGIIVLVLAPRACDNTDAELLKLKVKYEQELAIFNAAIAKAEAEREGLLITIANLQGAIDSANTIIAQYEEEQTVKDEAIATLNDSLALAKTDAERVPILTALVDEWKGKFFLAQDTIAKKDEVIFSLTEQYKAEIGIAGTWQAKYEASEKRCGTLEVQLNLVERKVQSLQRRGLVYYAERLLWSAAGYGLGSLFGH